MTVLVIVNACKCHLQFAERVCALSSRNYKMPLPNWMVYTLYGNAALDLAIFLSPGKIAIPDLIEAKFKSPEGEIKARVVQLPFEKVFKGLKRESFQSRSTLISSFPN